MRKFWTKLSKKLRLRKNAEHMKLQQDIKSCEYEDVHVLWEMLKKHDTDLSGSDCSETQLIKKGGASFWEILQFPKQPPLICHTHTAIN